MADQFMFGPAFMVCPVHEPMAYGPESTELLSVARLREVYLPAGCEWYDFWTDERLDGGTRLEAAAPLERIPVFVRAGSIVAMGPVRQHACDLPDAPLEILVYPGRDGAFSLYEDEGDGYGYEDGGFSTIESTWHDAARRLTIGRCEGQFPGMLRVRELVLKLDGCGIPEARHLVYRGQEVALQW